MRSWADALEPAVGLNSHQNVFTTLYRQLDIDVNTATVAD